MQSSCSFLPQLRLRTTLVLGALLCVLLAPGGWAQSTQGSIMGTVKDTSGALVPGAPVTLTNVGEGTVRTTKSNAEGDYAFLDVKAGRYSVAIEAAGFEKWSITGAVLNTQQQLRVDASLVIGSVDQVVTVSGDAATAIDTDTPSISAT